jgi:hypothetical protein
LQTEDVQKVLSSDTASTPDFEPHTSIFMSYIIKLKRSLHPTNDCVECPRAPEEKDLCDAAKFALNSAFRAGKTNITAYVPLLDEFDKIMNQLWLGGYGKWYEKTLGRVVLFKPTFNLDECFPTDTSPQSLSTSNIASYDSSASRQSHHQLGIFCNDLLSAATTIGLQSYVELKLKHDPTIHTRRTSQPLLLYTIHDKMAVGYVDMIQILLECGADPNQLWKGHTRWQHSLTSLHSGITSGNCLTEKARIIKLFLQYGASQYTTCTYNHRLPYVSRGRNSG